jgi:hypothetical protein
MIIVTGSKQAGTALWLQILAAAGFPSLGAEPSLQQGIFYATNPNPKTGRYVFPEQAAGHVVEISPAGVTRTDRAFIEKVLVALRPLREHVAAARRLHALEDAARGPALRLDPALEWWAETYGVLRDVSIRQYPVRFESQGRLLRDHAEAIAGAVAWLGRGDAARAADVVKPEGRTFEAADDLSVEPDIVALADELHAAVDARTPISSALLGRMNDAQRALLPRLLEEDARVHGRR